MKAGCVPAAAISERWHRAAQPSTHKSPKGGKTRILFEFAGEENLVMLFGVRRRALFQQKDLEPEPEPKELS